MKKIVLLLIISCISLQAYAQRTGTVRAVLIEAESSKPLAGALVLLTSASDTTKIWPAVSATSGRIELKGIPYGGYKATSNYLGYENIALDITVDKAVVDLGEIDYERETVKLDAVTTEGYAMRTSQEGDTLVYSADAFKVAQDADAETMLSKMPGIKVTDGQVEAQGEAVKKVYVNGKEFFGEDVNAAIKTMPAEVISKIEVYNKLSDQAEFTGVDDGDSYKAINIVTEQSTDKAQFGKLFAGYGFDEKYTVGANINFFNGDHRFTVTGMANNMNQQNFSSEDILGAMNSSGGRGGRRGNMVSRMPGVTSAQSIGLNYNGKFGEKLTLSGSYAFDNTDNEYDNDIDRQYFSDEATYRAYRSASSSNSGNWNHRFNARIEYKPNKNHSIMMRPSITFQNNDAQSLGDGATHDVTGADSTLVNSFLTESNSRNKGYNISNSIIYRVNLGKPGRMIAANISGSIGNTDRTGMNSTHRLNPESDPPLDSLFRQRTTNMGKNYSLGGGLTYFEPLTEFSRLNAEYRVSYRYSDIDRKAYLWDRQMEMYAPDFSDEYSNIYNSGYITQRVGPGYNWSKDRNVIVGNVSYQHSTLTSNRDYPTPQRKLDTSFENVVYFAMIRRYFTPQTSFSFRARSSTNNPSIDQLQDVVDMSNSLFVTAGNPELKPSYSHNIYANFIQNNITKGRTFTVTAGYGTQSNYIGDYLLMQRGDETIMLPNGERLESGGQFSKPVNLNGYWNINGKIDYGFPVNFIKSNVNLSAGASYSESPSMINDMRNTQSTQAYNGGLLIGSNISEFVDFTLTYNASYSKADHTLRKENDNESLFHAASARFKIVFWKGFTFSGNFSYSQDMGITDDYNEERLNCNLYIGKKVFKNQRGEVSFGVNDLFNQKTSFRRNITPTYIENVRNNVLGRFYGIQFVYNLRNLGKGSSAASSGGDSFFPGRPGGNQGPPPGGMPMGGPMGGGRPF